ncbi:Carboxypeptidase regulatory-like domain protein [uncultured archaeon]|nr:Carboxypeptidase regulatory-like domain protein [uncultured archaeon]
MRFFRVRTALFVLALLALQPVLCAQNESESPPGVPNQEGPVVARAVFANGSAVRDSAIVLLARSSESETIYRLITGSNGEFLLSLGAGSYDVDALLDYPGTAGIDFASTSALNPALGRNLTLIFYPSGSLSGKVLQGSSPVQDAKVRVECPSNSFDYGRINGVIEVRSGEAGDFLFRALPVGTCVVSASTDSLANSLAVQIAQGGSSSVSVELVAKAAQAKDNTAFVATAVAALAALIVFAYWRFGKPSKQAEATSREAAQPEAKKEHAPAREKIPEEEASKYDSAKVKAVLSTLSEREREITRFLLKSGGRAKRSTMQHKLLIPKTSLLRNLRSLERKNIVKLTPFGRNLLAEIIEPLFR